MPFGEETEGARTEREFLRFEFIRGVSRPAPPATSPSAPTWTPPGDLMILSGDVIALSWVSFDSLMGVEVASERRLLESMQVLKEPFALSSVGGEERGIVTSHRRKRHMADL